MRPFDEKFYLYIQVLIESFGGVKVMYVDGDGKQWAGIVWKQKRWDRKNRLVEAMEKNELNQTTTNESTTETDVPSDADRTNDNK